MSSRRVYITLNDKKEKDKIIADYLSQSYSESDAIKEAIYRLATNNIQQMQIDSNSTKKVQLASQEDKKVKKVTKRKNNNKVQKGINNINKDEKVTNDNNLIQSTPISENKVLNDTKVDSNDDITLNLGEFSDEPIEVKQDDKNKTEELRQKKLKALKQFM